MADKTKLELFKEMVGTKLADIKQLFDIPQEPTPVAEFVDVKTSEGVVIRISGKTPEVGGKCMVIDEKGETPAPDASYTLEDGSVITTKDGAITDVKQGEPKTEEPAKMDEEMNKEIAGVKESIKSITYKYAEIEKALNEKIQADKLAFEKVTKENEVLTAQNKAMFSLVEAIAGLPTEEPAQTPAQTMKKSSLAEFRESVKEMKAARKELRK